MGLDGQAARIFLSAYLKNIREADRLAADIENLIDEAAKEAARLASGIRNPARFTFASNASMRKRLEQIIARLRKTLVAEIEDGVTDAWTRSAEANRQVITALAAGNPELAKEMEAGMFTKATDRALQGWLRRKTDGLGLSERVWNLTSRLKTEMEQAVEIALAKGTPSAKLSQQIRQCLRNPDNYFRRFRYKNAQGQWARKWKKMYIDDEGKTRWQDVDLDDYSYGRGVYRSSYKNAMRLARTETNMAYQASDHIRWRQSWWVIGIRIGLSNNHPCEDICDELAGDYPADFRFTGWHPQCRCFAHALTISHEEITDYFNRKRAGEDMSGYVAPGTVKQPPKAFGEWVEANRERFAKKGKKLPYFMRDNSKYTGIEPPQKNGENL